MSVRSFPEPDTMRRGIAGVCKWGCGRPVEKPAIYWHRECFEQYALHTRAGYQKDHLVKRDGRKCAICGTSPTRWLRGTDDGYMLDWSLGKSDEPWLRELWHRDLLSADAPAQDRRLLGLQRSIERVCALEVDHRVPLWSVAQLPAAERRAFFGPDNLWLLCPDHHKEKTKREAGARAQQRRAA